MRVSKKIALIVSILTVFASISIVKADIYTGGRSKTSYKSVNVWADSSVTNNSYYSSIYSFGRSYWSNTGTSFNGFLVSTTNSNTSDEYYVSTTGTADVIGRTIYYKRVLGQAQTTSGNSYWEFCRVYIYSNNMDAAKMTAEQRRSNAAHEIGHSLKLAHPTTSQSSIMNQGIQDILPTYYDKSELARVWNAM